MRLAIALLALALTACSTGPNPRDRYARMLKPTANPSKVVAAELGFARMAQDEGQWTAFRATADDDAVMFVPQQVSAKAWLKGRADPPASVKWSPSVVYVSCNPATQMRDLVLFTEAGYQLGTVQPFDLFPQTKHLECVMTLSR